MKLQDKNQVVAVCIDDFALKKRQRYGTILVDIQSRKLVDMIETRELAKSSLGWRNTPTYKLYPEMGREVMRWP